MSNPPVKHLRSSTANKRPTASGIANGRLAINTASGTPGLYFADSASGVVKVGPAHVGASAPNTSPAGSSGNSLGELWIDNSTTIHGLNYYNGSAFVNLTPSGTTSAAGLVELATNGETQTGSNATRAVTPAGLQSKISDSTSTTSSTTIASATAVKAAYDLANAALPKSGGRITGGLEIGPSGSLSFEGSSDNSFETTLAVVNPTADRTITFPNITGTVITTGDSGTVTSTMIANGAIVNADVNASAAIAGTKISPDFGSQNITTTGKAGIGEGVADATLLRVGGSVPDDGQVYAVGLNVAATASATTSGIWGYLSDIGPTTDSANSVGSIYRYGARQINSFGSATVTNQYGFYVESDLIGATNNYAFYASIPSGTGRWNFYAASSAANFFKGDIRVSTPSGVNITSSSSNGHWLTDAGTAYHARSANVPLYVGRNTDDGSLVSFWQDGTFEGSISVAGSTVSYNPFLGSHWGRLVDGSKPDILPGTILDTVNQLIEWKQAKFIVGGEEKLAAYNGPAEAGDTVQIMHEGTSYSAIVQNETQDPVGLNKHVCVKVNDTPASKAVFGVFLGWDEDIPDGMISTWNDLYCAAVGNYFIRMAPGEEPEIGSLVEAGGNGCGVVQSDDVIRSKTVAKVTSSIPQKTYSDGSFLVTCVLYCG